ncbi:HNH endonuclease signature motif containing protein [Streptomyces sp. CFMR 7]|uniref:HNH endonuclease n=1 Tax=Streptomyces sp. CFMR 7 TaxID=1649184 RepID=UPI0011A4C98D
MPRAASICFVSGCTSRTVRSGRCEVHAPAVPKAWTRTSARNRTPNRIWTRRIRPAALVRDGFRCVRCGARNDLEVDHVVPVARGGSWTLENAQTLCQPCHKIKSYRDRY